MKNRRFLLPDHEIGGFHGFLKDAFQPVSWNLDTLSLLPPKYQKKPDAIDRIASGLFTEKRGKKMKKEKNDFYLHLYYTATVLRN